MSNIPSLINFEFKNFAAVLSSSISDGKRIESSSSGVNVGFTRKITLKLYNGGEDGLKISLEHIHMGRDYRFYATLRNSNGGAVCECSFDYEIDGLLPIKLSTVLDKEQNILVNNALWIDVLVQKKKSRLILSFSSSMHPYLLSSVNIKWAMSMLKVPHSSSMIQLPRYSN
jgi:hypothetical protein